MSVLIIGASGFIGSALAAYFKQSGYEVFGADIRHVEEGMIPFYEVDGSIDEWRKVFASRKFTCCINAAGSSNVNNSLTDPAGDFSLNVKDTSSILDGIRMNDLQTCSYIHISSAAVYGNPERLPVREDDASRPVSPYGWNKLMAEELCREYHELYGMPVAIARPFSVYGPGLQKQLFWDIYHKWKANPLQIELWGTGEETRDFIYISDLAKSFECILKNARMNGEVYNMGNGNMTSVKEAAALFMNAIDPSSEILFNGKVHQGNPYKWQADISLISDLGYRPSVSFEEGITHVANWMRQF